jgi:hypothetical protein
MKVKSSVLFGLIVLTCLAGGISLIYRLTKEAEVWNPSEMYKTSLGTSKGTKCTTVSYASGSTSDAPLVQLGAGSMSRPRVSYSYAPAGVASAYTQYPIGGTSSYSQSPIANSQGLYTTSSAELRSFGGGGNGGGVSMSGGSVHSSGSAVSAPSMGLSATMPNGSLFTFAGQNTNANIPILSGDAAIAAVASASSYTAAYSGIGYTTGGASRGIGGRKNGAVEDSWLQWLAKYGTGYGSGSGDDENGWTYTFDYYQLDKAYQDYVTNYWDDMWGEPPTFDQWLTWFQGNGGSHGYKGNTYSWVPVGDYYPLLILAILYVGYVAIRRRKSKISENNI